MMNLLKKNFLHLQQQLSEMEEKLANYRRFYNDTVLRYDRLLETVPTNLIAKMFHFKKRVILQGGGSRKSYGHRQVLIQIYDERRPLYEAFFT